LASWAGRPRYGYYFDQPIKPDEAGGIGGVEGKPVGGCDRGDHQIGNAATWRAAGCSR
jgi:hypothetical protein